MLRPVVEEIGEKSPLHPALIAPDSGLAVKVGGADDIDWCVRETDDAIFVLAAKREGATTQVSFRGLPLRGSSGAVLFEEPRTVDVNDGTFSDWFAPDDVHVYRFSKDAAK